MGTAGLAAGESLQFPKVLDQRLDLFVGEHNFFADNCRHEAFPRFGSASAVTKVTGVHVPDTRIIGGPDGGGILQPFAEPVLAVTVPHALQTGTHGREHRPGIIDFMTQSAVLFLE